MDGPILVGVDGSQESTIAAVLGHEIACATGTPLLVVTAVLDILVETAAARLGLDLEPLRQGMLRRAREATLEALAGVIPEGVLEQAVVARIGRPETVLESLALETRATLVVLGGREAGGLGRFRRGTALHLLRMTSVPVLSVDPSVSETGVQEIIAALDQSSAAAPTWREAKRLSLALGVPARVHHVVNDRPLSEVARLPIPMEELLAGQEAAARDFLTNLVGSETSLEIQVGNPRILIPKTAQRRPGTVVVVGSHGMGRVSRWLLGSVAEGLLRDFPSSLMAVPSMGHGEDE